MQQLSQQTRAFAAPALTVKFKGCKLKPYSSYKARFKMTGTGKIRYQVRSC